MTAVRIAFPLGAVVALVDSVGNTEISVKPLVFLPGSAALTPALDARVGEVARFLRKSEDVSPALCGIATAEDIAVREALVSEYAIPQKRLYDCAASFRGRDGAVPAVVVRLNR